MKITINIEGENVAITHDSAPTPLEQRVLRAHFGQSVLKETTNVRKA